MKCYNCNNEIHDLNASYCPYCKTAFTSSQSGSYSYQSQAGNGSSYNNYGNYNAFNNYNSNQAPNNNNQLIVKIGLSVLAVVYLVVSLVTLFHSAQTLFHAFSWGFSFSSLIWAGFSFLKFLLQFAIAFILLLTAFTDNRHQVKDLFTTLAVAGIGIVLIVTLAQFEVFVFTLFQYGFSAGSFGYIFIALMKSFFFNAVALGIVYGLLYYVKEAPTGAYYKQISALGEYISYCFSIVITTAKELFHKISVSVNNSNAKRTAQTASMPNGSSAGYGVPPVYNSTPGYTNGPTYQSATPNMQQPLVPATNGTTNFTGAVALKTDRNLLTHILLCIITCGIYGYFFIYNQAREVNIACEGDGQTTAGLLKFIIFSILTCGFYSYFWWYSLGNRLASNAPRYGMSFTENGTTVLMWFIFGSFLCGIGPFIAIDIVLKNTNSICMAYNRQNGLC